MRGKLKELANELGNNIRCRTEGVLVLEMKTQLPILGLASYSHPCSYLPGRDASMEFALVRRMSASTFGRLLELGFRRSGKMFYRPACKGCHECKPLRVLAQSFRPDRSMRRNWRANQDLEARIGTPRSSQTKVDLYHRYLEARHELSDSSGFEDFLVDSPVETLEIEFRLHGELVSVGIVDMVPSGMSAVYCYFEPELAHRGLGTYSILWQIDYCRRHGWPHCYLGFYVRECQKMNYKNRFVPHEIFNSEGAWQRIESRGRIA